MEARAHVELEASGDTPAPCYEDLACKVGFPLVDGALTEEQVFAGCEEANRLGVGETVIRPADVDLARNWVQESAVRCACLTGFPGGSSTTPARLYEARDVLRRGVKQLVVTMNLGKLVSRKFLYLESELLQLAESCRQNEARLRLLFEVEQLQQDHVLIGVRLCKRTSVHGIDLWFRGSNEEFTSGVARYVLHHAKQKLEVSVHSPTMTLPAALALREAGVARLVTPQAGALLAAWEAELERRRKEAEAQTAPSAAEEPEPPSALNT
ncbi:MAG: hypothetical protein KIT83_09585 [Bryobacterales bacterium]|nr:hypothetical protein [Bryobacterales bacterium]